MALKPLKSLFPQIDPNPNANLLPESLKLSGFEQRIIIVGGGPSGMHMSACLAAKGYTKVTLLEAEPEIGGKSMTVYDDAQPSVPQEMGTCYLNAQYKLVRSLLEEYDPENTEEEFANEKNGRMVFGVVIADEDKRKYTEGLDYSDWVNEETEKVSCPSCCWCLPDSLQGIPIFVAFAKYLKIHVEIFGRYSYGMPPKPKDWSRINMTAQEFLKQNDLEILTPIFIYSQQVQGYGMLDQVPAFYLLWWNHPDIARNTIGAILGGPPNPGLALLKNGWQSLWLKMKERHSKEVTYITSASVTEIKRSPTVEVTYRQGEKLHTLQGDVVITAIDLFRFRHLICDLAPEEEQIFSQLQGQSLTTTLYKGKTTDHDYTVETWFGRMGFLDDGVGQFYAQRNSRMAARPNVPSNGVELRVAYQYMPKPLQTGDEAKLATVLKENLKSYAGEPEVEILLQKAWGYFPHFENEALVKEFPWKILDLQGKRNTIFIGSSVCFESALDQVAYNLMLLSKMTA